MYKKELDELLHSKDLTQSEYDSFFETMSENNKGEMIGVIPNGHVSDIYNFNGDMFNNTHEFVLKHIAPPLGAERFGTCFSKYGYTLCGICDDWNWLYVNGKITNKEGVGHEVEPSMIIDLINEELKEATEPYVPIEFKSIYIEDSYVEEQDGNMPENFEDIPQEVLD